VLPTRRRSPRFDAFYKIAMSVAVGYMLILMN